MGCRNGSETIDNLPRNMTKHFINSNFREKYEFICILGSGGFGEVRLFRLKDDHKMLYAIKSVHKNKFSNAQNILQIYRKEVEILNKMDHPNIVKYYESYEESAYLHLVMEYIYLGIIYLEC
jgi:serine/threonine protein kinase